MSKEIAPPAPAATGENTPVVNSPAPSPELKPVETPAHNEPPARTETPRKAGIVEKARSAAARVLSEAGFEFHKGRGRPKNCPDCKNKLPEKSACTACGGTGHVPGKLDGSISSVPPLAVPSGIPENSPLAQTQIPSAGRADGHSTVSELFRRSCVASVKGILGILKAVVAAYANAAGCRPDFTEKTISKAEPDAEALKDFTESLDAVLKKRNIQPENAEEWALAINGARLLAPFALLIAEFKGEIKRNRMSDHQAREIEKLELRRQWEAEQRRKAE